MMLAAWNEGITSCPVSMHDRECAARATIAPDVTPTPAGLPAPTEELDESGCPARPFGLFFAVVSYEDTVVTVNAPLCILCVGRGVEPDPYDSREGMEAIVRGLRLRQTGE